MTWLDSDGPGDSPTPTASDWLAGVALVVLLVLVLYVIPALVQ